MIRYFNASHCVDMDLPSPRRPSRFCCRCTNVYEVDFVADEVKSHDFDAADVEKGSYFVVTVPKSRVSVDADERSRVFVVADEMCRVLVVIVVAAAEKSRFSVCICSVNDPTPLHPCSIIAVSAVRIWS